MKPYQPVVLDLLRSLQSGSVLDAPSGSGWLRQACAAEVAIDGLDLFAAEAGAHYRHFFQSDMNEGIPRECPMYDCIVSCEGLEHLHAPSVFLQAAKRHLRPGGLLIVSTPNVWYPGARLQYLLRGFFPSFPCLVGRIAPGTHMHVTPWSFPQLYLILRMLGFHEITLHQSAWPAPKHAYERILGFPQWLHCRWKERASDSEELTAFWRMAGSPASLYARGLVVSARVPEEASVQLG
ncbi:MAG: methyltransferase domain-containing protein [Magnetococcales bacterium]|nr:methyltransferase domain-containing protein [Magnetococcales bacterium]NGZ04778.1 methyltransferase domain-containing protein [Magnetococcales bacterium]